MPKSKAGCRGATRVVVRAGEARPIEVEGDEKEEAAAPGSVAGAGGDRPEREGRHGGIRRVRSGIGSDRGAADSSRGFERRAEAARRQIEERAAATRCSSSRILPRDGTQKVMGPDRGALEATKGKRAGEGDHWVVDPAYHPGGPPRKRSTRLEKDLPIGADRDFSSAADSPSGASCSDVQKPRNKLKRDRKESGSTSARFSAERIRLADSDRLWCSKARSRAQLG